MRYIEIKEQKEEIISNLEDMIKNHKNHRVRNRALAIKMNIENRVTIPELAKYFNVKQRAIYDWFNNFDKYSVLGLVEKKGRGRKRKIKDKKN